MEQRFDPHANQPFFKHLFHRLEKTGIPLARLKDVSHSIFSGITPLSGGDAYEEQGQGVPFIRSGEILENGLVSENTDIYLKKEIHDGLMRRSQLCFGDLLIAIVGATIGRVGVYNRKHSANINQAIAAARVDSERVLPEYLASFLMTKTGQHVLDQLKRPVARANINLEEVGDIIFPLPPLPAQREMVGEMERAREGRRRKLAQADALLSGLDAFLLERLGLTPPPPQPRIAFAVRLDQVVGHRIDAPAYQPLFAKEEKTKTQLLTLADVAEIEGNTVPKPQEEKELVPYIGLPECELTEVREVVMRPYREVKGRGIARPGDILFARIEPSVFNKKYVLAEDLKGFDYAYVSTEFYAVRAKTNLLDQGYLYAMFFSAFVYNQVLGKTTGSSGRRRIDPEMFAALKIPVPEKEVQLEISNELRQRRQEARRLREEVGREWEAAKARFEARLLGTEAGG